MVESLVVWCAVAGVMGQNSRTQQPKRCLQRDDSSRTHPPAAPRDKGQGNDQLLFGAMLGEFVPDIG